ncbi:hypothetical protein [Streptomyces sp.]|nr:hypothetical protein [Streptomyces sp.]HZF87709.1 hypothetical protein [Streptomyces sp.]
MTLAGCHEDGENEDQYTPLPVGLALVGSGKDFTRYGVLLAGGGG